MRSVFQSVLVLMLLIYCTAAGAQIIINEVDSDQVSADTGEFIELYDGGVGGTSLTGYVIVLFTGVSDTSYMAIDLDGYSTDSNGFFAIGSTGMGNQIELAPGAQGWLQNGPDAVALYLDDATTFPNGTLVTSTNLVDALVYGNDNADDPELIAALLNPGEGQVNENQNGTGTVESMGRCPNGSGGAMNTSTYSWDAPSVLADNVCIIATPTQIPTATPTYPPAPVCDTEYLLNGNMESWTVSGAAGPPDNWVITSAFGSTVTATQSTTQVHSGSYSTLVFKSDNNGAQYDSGQISQYIVTEVVPNEVYELSCWVYDNDYRGHIRAQLRFYNNSGQLIQYTDFTPYSINSSSWQQLTLAVVSDPTAAQAEVRIWFYDTDSADLEIYVDDITLVQPCFPVPTPSPTQTPPPTPIPTIAPCDTNIIPNASFESWSFGGVDDWHVEPGISTNPNTANPHDFLTAVELSNALSGTDFTSSYVPVNNDTIYNAGMWVIDNDPNVNAQIYVLFYNSDLNWIGSTTWNFTSGESSDWQLVNIGQFWTPASAEWARMRVRFVDNGGNPPPTGGVLTVDECWLIEPCAQTTPTPSPVPTAAIPRSIYEIQYTTDPGGASPFAGTEVATSGYVTAVEEGNEHIFIQDFPGPWSGLMIYSPTGPGAIQQGDSIYVQGIVEEMNGMTVINDPAVMVVSSSGNPIPDVWILSSPAQMNTEAFESVLVRLKDVDITDVNVSAGEWTVTDSLLNNAIVDNIYSYTYVPTIGEFIEWVQGPVTEETGTYKLQPRDDQDISATYRQVPSTGLAGLAILLAAVGWLILRKK